MQHVALDPDARAQRRDQPEQADEAEAAADDDAAGVPGGDAHDPDGEQQAPADDRDDARAPDDARLRPGGHASMMPRARH